MTGPQQGYGGKQPEYKLDAECMLTELGNLVNRQGAALERSMERINQLSFRLGKMDEQVQLLRNTVRIQRDRFAVAMRTLSELGVTEPEGFDALYNVVERKLLPISSDGRMNAEIRLTRYNVPKETPEPEQAERRGN